jgi:hypothetical protein
MTTSEKAPRCTGSNTQQSIEPPLSWSHDERKPCTVCGQMVKFRVRATDLPPWARILPHRTDGTPTR